MNPAAVSMFGSGQPHNNLMPFLGLYWIIAMQGVYPPRN
jgi:microcystin-dependent protein